MDESSGDVAWEVWWISRSWVISSGLSAGKSKWIYLPLCKISELFREITYCIHFLHLKHILRIMNYLKNLFSWKFSVIFLLTFTNGLSFAMLSPVFPSIIRSFDQPEILYWFAVASYSLFQFLSGPIIGKLSDTFGRKPLLLVTQSGTLLAWIILWIAYLIPETKLFNLFLLPIFLIFLSRAIDGITGWNASVVRASIADKSGPDSRSTIFGKNSAIMWFAIIVGPALGSFSLGLWYWFLGTAVFWAIISTITLSLIYTIYSESLPESERKSQLNFNAKKINIFSQYIKWRDTWAIKYASFLRVCIFIAFISGTTISTLYLLDTMWFSEDTVWYFLAFTGSFIIFHQSVSVPRVIKYFWDSRWILFWLLFMWLWYLGIALSWENIYLYTLSNFVSVFWIAICFSTNSWLFSKSVDSTNQWEILWFTSSINSFISIWVPPTITFLYGFTEISIYYFIAIMPIFALIVWKFYFWKQSFNS